MSASRDEKASRLYAEGVPGFYVFALAAQVIVAGPYKVLDMAEYQAALREPPAMGVTAI